MVVSRFDETQNIFYLKSQDDDSVQYAVFCKLKLKGTVAGQQCTVDISKPSADYELHRFINPYLNAQDDLFKINYNDKNIGYIIPFTALEDNDNNFDEDFDEYKQAYKYYCVKSFLECYDFPNHLQTSEMQLNDIVETNSIYVILYKPLIDEEDFKIDNCLPSFALNGYYLFPENTKPSVLSLVHDRPTDSEFNALINTRYRTNRSGTSIRIKTYKNILQLNPLIELFYKKLLIESNEPLHRFIVLYQIIELLIDKRFRKEIEDIFREKDTLSNHKLAKKINKITNNKNIINKIFENVVFPEKEEITNVMRDFIVEFDSEFNSQSPGECLYELRNLIFHDYKSLLEKNKHGEIASLVIQCEILIHHLIMATYNNP
ncbi:MAG: hypothetical protein EPO24_08475 [Bacteroidetes bacterium]|nr:MAG: hypothetical protein EPO24_08475 [Bacteroidota bacterium]